MFKKTIYLLIACFFVPCSFGISAESGGMPQLDPEFWVSQIFWLVITFGVLFVMLSKFILPKISNNLESRKSQIMENIETAEKQRLQCDKNNEEYLKLINDSKIEAKNIINDAKKKLLDEISNKRKILEKELDEEIKITEKEIKDIKINSNAKINQIATDTSSELLKQILGTEINKSNISAIIDEISKKNKGYI